MSVDYGFILAETILELSILKENMISQTNNITKGLDCGCKKIIFNEYIIGLSNLMVAVANFSLLTEDLRDKDTLIYRFSFVEKQYRKMVSCRLYNNPQVETKLLAIFQLLYFEIEEQVLNKIKKRFFDLSKIKSKDITSEMRIKICRENLADVYLLAEQLILALAGVQIDCTMLKDEIFENIKVKKYIDMCELLPEDLYNKKIKDCCLYPEVPYNNVVRLFITPDVYKVSDWFENLISIYLENHMHPKEINFILDYKLMNSFSWTQSHEDIYNRMKTLFNSVSFINCDKIDFNCFSKNKNLEVI